MSCRCAQPQRSAASPGGDLTAAAHSIAADWVAGAGIRARARRRNRRAGGARALPPARRHGGRRRPQRIRRGLDVALLSRLSLRFCSFRPISIRRSSGALLRQANAAAVQQSGAFPLVASPGGRRGARMTPAPPKATPLRPRSHRHAPSPLRAASFAARPRPARATYRTRAGPTALRCSPARHTLAASALGFAPRLGVHII